MVDVGDSFAVIETARSLRAVELSFWEKTVLTGRPPNAKALIKISYCTYSGVPCGNNKVGEVWVKSEA